MAIQVENVAPSLPPPILQADALRVCVGERVLCDNLHLEVAAGERIAILGCNGAGKSSLLSVLAGLREPSGGGVQVQGKAYAARNERKNAVIRGWLSQSQQDAFASSVLETVLMGRHPYLDRWAWESERDIELAKNALAEVDLSGYEERNIQTLSGGERQRLAIATLLCQSPQLFLLDEPVAYLDLKHQIRVMARVSELVETEQKAVVMVLHEPALAWRFSDRVLCLFGNGTYTLGPTREMLTAENLSELYQHPMRAVECHGQVVFSPE